MRLISTVPLILALLASGCGKHSLTLPTDPVDRAATCAAVTANSLRKGSTNMGPLRIEEQGKLLHYALLEGAATPEFSQDTAAAVNKRMSDVEQNISKGKWGELVAPCHAAYPATTIAGEIALPKDPFDTRLGCYALASFVTSALQNADKSYADQLNTYMAYRRSEDPRIASAYSARGIRSFDAKEASRRKALSIIVKAGSPIAVLQSCIRKYSEREGPNATN